MAEVENPFQAAQTVDPEVRAYVYSLVTALGGSGTDDDGRYILGDDALACLRDLKRWLKLYDEKMNRLDVARCLAEAKLVNGDLLPILAAWPEEASNDRLKARVALACLEILVPLTWPLDHGGEITVNHHRHTPFIQQAQVLYKAGILGHDTCPILRQIVRLGLPAIAMRRDERTPRDEGIMKLILYLCRNLTAITPIPSLPSQGIDEEVSRSATIETFRQQDVLALLLTMCSNMGEDFDSQDVIILEIIFNIIKGVEVDKLWLTQDQRKTRDTDDLKDVLSIERGMHRDAAKVAPTRHGRFGTMIWIKREEEKVSAVSGQDNLRPDRNYLHNMDKTKKWNKPQQRRKDIEHTIHDFDKSVRLTSSASALLRNFAEEFLDSGFNPLITHLRKAIEREAGRLLDVNYRQFFYVVAWFLQAERARRERTKRNYPSSKLQSDFEADSFSLVAAVLNQETFITLNRYMHSSYDNKEWQDLNASMRCFTQILLTVQEMAQSPLDEDQEIADNIQNRIFYEETTHDRIVSILKGYKDQGFGYLDACTELSHVFLRMLERYSKENADLQIRSRRRARRKKKEEEARRQTASAEGNEGDDDDRSENEDVAEVAQISRERKFDFTRFAAKFTSQSSVDTFVSLLTFYRELSAEQLKRAHRFLHRVAFKQELSVLLFRLDIIALLQKMIKGPEGLDLQHAMYGEWTELVRQVLKRLFKKLEQRPEVFVELLFSKINATLYYLEYGREKQTVAAARGVAEIEVKPAPGREIEEKIGIVIAVLQRDGKTELVQWVRETLQKAKDERTAWEAEAAARAAEPATEQAEGESVLAPAKPSYITVRPSSEEIQTAIIKNVRLRLLMMLAGFERLGIEDTADSSWIVPSALTAAELEITHSLVERYLQTQWTNDLGDEEPEDLLRRVRNVARNVDDDEEEARRDAFIDDSEGASSVDEEFMFPDNVRSKTNPAAVALAKLKKVHRKRKRGEEDDNAVVEARRKAREAAALERRRKIKSELLVGESDEEMDGEEVRRFFVREEEVRKRQAERVRRAMRLERAEAGSGRKERGRNVETDVDSEIEEDSEVGMEVDMDNEDNLSLSSPRRQHDEDTSSDVAMEDEETPLSSQSAQEGRRKALMELQQPRAEWDDTQTLKLAAANAEEVEEDDDEMPVSRRSRLRAGFVVDSSDEE